MRINQSWYKTPLKVDDFFVSDNENQSLFLVLMLFCYKANLISSDPELDDTFGIKQNWFNLIPSKDRERNVRIWKMFDQANLIYYMEGYQEENIYYPADYESYLNHEGDWADD